MGCAAGASASTCAAAAQPAVLASISSAVGAGGGVSAAAVFGASSGLMVPVYAIMAFFPTAKLTRSAILNPAALYLGLAALYAGALVAALNAGLGAALGAVAASVQSSLVGGAGLGALDLSPVAAMFEKPLVTLVAWLHLFTLDALMAREIALDGLRTGVATAHSVLLCFFFGPTGLLSHAVTRLLSGRGRI